MKRDEINIRDPYVLVSGGKYYLYGTRSATCWGSADGFDCYVSSDLENWEGPIEIFHRPADFWADRCYWAPECYEQNGTFFLVTTLGSEHTKKGVHVFTSNSPTGPFSYVSQLTPLDWCCIDGSLYFPEQGNPWLLFSHSFEDDCCQDMCAVMLQEDLLAPAGEPVPLFQVSDAPWAVPVPFAKAEFGLDGDIYFSDGPCALRLQTGALAILWSGWGHQGYAVGVAVSDCGKMTGPWHQEPIPLVPGNAGHGMVFTALDGKRYYALHSPNDKFLERPVFRELSESEGRLRLL